MNDLSRRNSSTFIQLGELGFTQDEIRFIPRKVPTDGLLIKGSYTTITLAVYGNLTKLEQENTPPQPTIQHSKHSNEPQATQTAHVATTPQDQSPGGIKSGKMGGKPLQNSLDNVYIQ